MQINIQLKLLRPRSKGGKWHCPKSIRRAPWSLEPSLLLQSREPGTCSSADAVGFKQVSQVLPQPEKTTKMTSALLSPSATTAKNNKNPIKEGFQETSPWQRKNIDKSHLSGPGKNLTYSRTGQIEKIIVPRVRHRLPVPGHRSGSSTLCSLSSHLRCLRKSPCLVSVDKLSQIIMKSNALGTSGAHGQWWCLFMLCSSNINKLMPKCEICLETFQKHYRNCCSA